MKLKTSNENIKGKLEIFVKENTASFNNLSFFVGLDVLNIINYYLPSLSHSI